jgi:hypothetical protein
MVSLLVLSLVLSAPAAATQTAAVANDAVVTQSSPTVQVQPDLPLIELEEPAEPFDPIVIRPDSDICYKIRAYIFSKGSNPRLLRETTCGPSRPTARQLEGAQPKLVPLDVKDKSPESPQR